MRPDTDESRAAAILAADPRRSWCRVFVGNGFAAILSVDGGELHASISHRKRYPTWEEIKLIRYWFFPRDLEVVMVLPADGYYVNFSPNCFHLWQSACQREGR
jgi:hypothetical protein